MDRRLSPRGWFRIPFLLICLASAGTVVAAGGVRPDGTTQTTTDAARNGVPMVDVAAPNAQGVSRNSYSDFNVDQRGLILNNADSVGVSQLGGALPPNPHFHVGDPARIILNEVRSTNPSSLNGYTEIFGHRAEFILANPNGITCDGCGFINTSRATLITGSEDNRSGGVGTFTLGPGNIAVQGQGLVDTDTSYVDLISQAVRVQAKLQVNHHLAVRTGNDRYDHATDTVTSKAGSGSGTAPAYAIDAGQLGSMYAGQIDLVTTQAGVGVRTAAPVEAQDSVYMQSAGPLETAQVHAGNRITARVAGELRQQGDYRAAGSIDLQAGTLNLTNAVESDRDLRLVQTQGDWTPPELTGGTGLTELGAPAGALQIDNKIWAGGDLLLSALDINNANQLAARGDLELAASGDITNAEGVLVFAGRNMALRADGTLANRGELFAMNALNAAGLSGSRMVAFNNRGGRVESGGDMTLAADQVLNTHNFPSSDPPTSTAQTDRPAVRHNTYFDWNYWKYNWKESQNPNLTRGLIQTDGDLTATADSFTNELSDIFAAGDIDINAKNFTNHAYQLREAYDQLGKYWGITGRPCRHGHSIGGGCIGGHDTTYGWIYYHYQAIRNTGESIPASVQAGRTLSINASQKTNNGVTTTGGAGASVNQPTDPLAGLTLPGDSGLFRPNPAPRANNPYLIETDPNLIDVSELLGSQYFLQRIGYQPGKDPTLFLGDAAYDQRLLADQVRDTAGTRFLFADAQSNNAQYRRLADQAADERDRLDLQLGQALSDDQVADLTEDILWYVNTQVEGRTVLAPRLYLSPKTRQLLAQRRTARLSGTRVAINAASLLNEGNITSSDSTAIATSGDFDNRGGTIDAGAGLRIAAGGDLRSASVVHTFHAGADIHSSVTRIASLNAGQDMNLSAGGTLNLAGGQVTARRDVSLNAGGKLSIDALSLTNRDNRRVNGWNRTDTRVTHAVTDLSAGRRLSLDAGADLRIEAAEVNSGGDTNLTAGGNLQLLAARDTHDTSASKIDYGGFLNSTKKTTTITTHTATEHGAHLNAGGTLDLASGGDTTFVASSASSGGDASLDTRGGDILLLAGKDTDFYRYQHTSDGLVYTKQDDRGHYSESLAASHLKSGGNLRFSTGRSDRSGDVIVAGADVASAGTMEFGGAYRSDDDRETERLAGDDGHVLDESDSARIGNLRIASVGLQHHSWNYHSEKLNGLAALGIGAIAMLDPTGGKIVASSGIVLQKTDRVDTQGLHQQGADVGAGGDLGAYAQGDITASGSRLHANGQGTLDAKGDVQVLASVDRITSHEEHSIARIKGASAQWDGRRLSAGIDGKYRKEETDQSQLTQRGSSLAFGGDLSVHSGGQTTVAASSLQAGRDLSLTADKGLSVLSADDVLERAEKLTTADLRLSVGVGNAYNDFAQSFQTYKRAKEQRQAAEDALAKFDRELAKMKADEKKGLVTPDDVRLRSEDRKYYVANVALAKVNELNAAVQVGQAGERMGAAATSSAGTGFYADAMFELHGRRTSTDQSQSRSVGSSLVAGRDLALTSGADLHIQGSDLGAQHDLTLAAANDVTIEAARNTDSSRQDRRSVSYQYSVGTYGVGANTASWNAGASVGSDRSDSVSWRNSQLAAGSALTVHTGRDTHIAGANLEANDLAIDTGRNLDIASRQNTTYARGQDAGLSYGTGRVGVNGGHRSQDRRWVDTPTTLIGHGSVAIDTGETTDITGALVAQINTDGTDGGNLTLRTRRLRVHDLTDTDNADHWSAGFSTDRGTDKNPSTGGGVPNSAKTSAQLAFGGHVYGQITHATIGQGTVLVADDGLPTGLNRDIDGFQTVTAHRNTGGLDADVTIDHRMLSVQGWRDIGKDFYDTYRHGADVATGIDKVLTNDKFGARDYQRLMGDKYNQRQSFAMLLHNAALRAGLNQADAYPEQIQAAMAAYVRDTTDGKRLAQAAGLHIYNGDPTAIGLDTAGARFDKNFAMGGYDTVTGQIAINAYATDLTNTDHKLFVIGHEGYHALADAKGYGYDTATEESLADSFGQSASDVWDAYSWLGGYDTDVGAASYHQDAWLRDFQDGSTVSAGNAWVQTRPSAVFDPRQLHPIEARLIRKHAGEYADATGQTYGEAVAELTEQALRQVDKRWAGRFKENPRAAAFLFEVAVQTPPVDVGGGSTFDARGTPAYDNPIINAAALTNRDVRAVYGRVNDYTKVLPGIAYRVDSRVLAASDAAGASAELARDRQLTREQFAGLQKVIETQKYQIRTFDDYRTNRAASLKLNQTGFHFSYLSVNTPEGNKALFDNAKTYIQHFGLGDSGGVMVSPKAVFSRRTVQRAETVPFEFPDSADTRTTAQRPIVRQPAGRRVSASPRREGAIVGRDLRKTPRYRQNRKKVTGDGRVCEYCQERPATQADHIDPVDRIVKEGNKRRASLEELDVLANDLDNLAGSCGGKGGCNPSKYNHILSDEPGPGKYVPKNPTDRIRTKIKQFKEREH